MPRRRALIHRKKLTKESFANIPKGLYLVTEASSFAETIDSPKERENQWKALQQLKAVGKPCYLADSKAAFEQWQKATTARSA